MTRVRFAVMLALGIAALVARSPAHAQTWMADNGNGTFSNPLFYDEFSDPDLIRVGDDFYLTGTTMHAMPGLPVLHSTDLVNWELASYAVDRLDHGPAYRLEGATSTGVASGRRASGITPAPSTSSATSTGRRRSTSPRATRAAHGRARR